MTERQSVDDLLIAHAAGKLPEPVGLAVATHLALNPAARARYRRYEAFGGVLARRAGAGGARAGRLGSDGNTARRRVGGGAGAGSGVAVTDRRVPRPLRDYLPGPLESLRWRFYGPAAEIELPIKVPGYRTTLIRVRAGRHVPQHTHEGNELTVVLEGAFRDETGHYGRGDLMIADSSLDHRPRADEAQDCVCLVVTDAPLRFTGRFGQFLNPFIRF